jgi:adenine/guanine phosphoribosyltransferase-like PRPP-binding protein
MDRVLRQVGSLGSGNHFLEVQAVDEVYGTTVARRFGPAPGQVCVVIHCGSRGLGRQICGDHVRIMEVAMGRYGIAVPDRQLACAPVNSPEGHGYLGAMAAAANYGRCCARIPPDMARDAAGIPPPPGRLHHGAAMPGHDAPGAGASGNRSRAATLPGGPRRLASRLVHLRGEPVVVLGLPRGGVPVALEVARALDAPLDVIIVRKLGVPFQSELAMGAVGEDGVVVISTAVVRLAGVSAAELSAVRAQEQARVAARAARYRARRPREPLAGRVAVVVDDGIATGSTARAACQVTRAHGAARVVWPCRSRRPGGSRDSVARPMNWFAWAPRPGSAPSARSTPTSPRPPTMRSSPAWNRRPHPPRHGPPRLPQPTRLPRARRPAVPGAWKWNPSQEKSAWPGIGIALDGLECVIHGDVDLRGFLGLDSAVRPARIWARGWPAIETAGHDRMGPVTVLFVPIDRRHEARLYRDVTQLAPGADWSSGGLRLRSAQPDAVRPVTHTPGTRPSSPGIFRLVPGRPSLTTVPPARQQ